VKLHHYDQMMAYLTRRQKFSNGGDAILPKPNPLSPQERNQKVFSDYVSRMKHYLTGAEMPEWFVKDLIIKKAEELGVELKADGGRIGFSGKSQDVRNILDGLKTGAVVDRQAIIKKTGIEDSSLTKILKEYEHKNFTKKVYPSTRKGKIIIQPTAEQNKIAEHLFGKKFNQLNADKRAKISTGAYDWNTVTDHRRVQLEKEWNVKAKELGYTKSYADLGYEEQRRVRLDKKPARVDFRGSAQKDALHDELRLLHEDTNIQKIFQTGNISKKDLALVKTILGPDTNAAMKLAQLASVYKGDIDVEGIKLGSNETTKLGTAEKILKNFPYSDWQRVLDELQIGKSVGEESLSTTKRFIRKRPDYTISKDYHIDEIGGVSSSAKAKSFPYGNFAQIIKKDLNSSLKWKFDRQKLTREIELQKAIEAATQKAKAAKVNDIDSFIAKDGDVKTQIKKFNTLVADFETQLNKNIKPGEKKIKLFEVSLDSPEKTVADFDKLPDTYKKAFISHHKNKKYSFKVAKNTKTLKEIKTIVQDKNRWSGILDSAKKGMDKLLFKAGELDVGGKYKKFRPWIEKGVDFFPGKVDNAAAAAIDFPMMMMAGAPEPLALASAASMFLKEPSVGKVANVAIDMAHLSEEDKWAARAAERKDTGMTYLKNIKHMANQEKFGENLEASKRLRDIQSTAKDIEPFELDEKEEVVTENKPIYGPIYADQIKKLKIS
jgi:hypothetical protein